MYAAPRGPWRPCCGRGPSLLDEAPLPSADASLRDLDGVELGDPVEGAPIEAPLAALAGRTSSDFWEAARAAPRPEARRAPALCGLLTPPPAPGGGRPSRDALLPPDEADARLREVAALLSDLVDAPESDGARWWTSVRHDSFGTAGCAGLAAAQASSSSLSSGTSDGGSLAASPCVGPAAAAGGGLA